MAGTRRHRDNNVRGSLYRGKDSAEPSLTPCPTPHKFRYRSRSEAKKILRLKRSIFTPGDLPHPYLCDCGCWHLGRLQRGGRIPVELRNVA